MKESIKSIIKMLKYNFLTLVLFEVFYKAISVLAVRPLFEACFGLVMRLAGYSYITKDNMISFFKEPIVIIFLIIMLFVVMVYSMLDLTAIITILDMSKQGKKIGLKDTVKITLNKGKKMFRPGNILLMLFVLFMMPFLNLGTSSSFVSVIRLPEFVTDYITDNWWLVILVAIGVIALTYVFLKWIFAIHFYVIEGHSFKEARSKSIFLIKGRKIRMLIYLLITQAVYTGIYWGILFGGTLLIKVINHFTSPIIAANSILSAVVWVFISVLFFIYFSLVTPACYVVISCVFYNRLNANGMEELHVDYEPEKLKSHKRIKTAVIIAYIGLIVAGSIYSYGVYNGTFSLQIEHVRTMEITAHRGASYSYPENTMVAFVGAEELGADWVELDVQQTKDGYIVVSHDSNFSRTAHVNKNVWTMTLEEVKELDVSAGYGSQFDGVQVPTLEEVIIWAKDEGMRLNIELKPTGHEKDFEKCVVDLINEYEFDDRCVVTSLEYNVLKNVKEYDEEITTVYVMAFAYGNITRLTAADAFSVEASNISDRLVKNVHKEGKQIMAWTVNREASIKAMVNYSVDNIITDNVTLAKEVVYESKTSDWMTEYLDMLENLFK